jgi:hypothetical protein
MEEMLSTRLPVLANNPIIDLNPDEYLQLPVIPIDIDLFVGSPTKPSKCDGTSAACITGERTWFISHNSPWKYESIGICERCKHIECDADGDSAPNETDNCPVTANPDRLDQNHDNVGDVCELPPLKVLIDNWLKGILPDMRFFMAIDEYPGLGPVLPSMGGRKPLPGWKTQFPPSTDSFKRYSTVFMNGRISDDHYKTTLRAVLRGATYTSDNGRVTDATVSITPIAQIISLKTDAKNGSFITLKFPRVIIDGFGTRAPLVMFSMRTKGATPGTITESVLGADRVFELRLKPGTTAVILERHP